MGFVNKVIDKTGVEADIHDARIDELPNPVKAEDGKLLVDEVVRPIGPIPVATIDGVDYFHKREFDLSQFEISDSPIYYSLLTGNRFDDYPAEASFSVYPNHTVTLLLNIPGGGSTFTIYFGEDPGEITYTSRAFIVVSNQHDYDNTHILLQGATAYYGKLEGNIFTSYWNEEGEGPVEVVPITKIKDANNNEVKINDARIVAPAEATGKVLKDDFSWGDVEEELPDFSYGNENDILSVVIRGKPELAWVKKPVGFDIVGDITLFQGNLYDLCNAIKTYLGLASWSTAGNYSLAIKYNPTSSNTNPKSQVIFVNYEQLYKGYDNVTIKVFDPCKMRYFAEEHAVSELSNISITSLWKELSGGTKLYKHEVKFKSSASYMQGNKLYLILVGSQYAQALSSSDIANITEQDIMKYYIHPQKPGVFFEKKYVSYPTVSSILVAYVNSFSSSTPAYSSYEMQIEDIESDTVTAL